MTSTTTVGAIRDNMASLIRAVVPDSLSHRRFRETLGDVDFLAYAESGKAALREFDLIDSGPQSEPFARSAGLQLEETTITLAVCYPKKGTYGGARKTRRAAFDVIREDMAKIDTAIGARGAANYVAGTQSILLEGGERIVESTSHWFLILSFRTLFYRSV